MKSIQELRAEAGTALRDMEAAAKAFDRAGPNTDLDGLRSAFDAAESDHKNAVGKVDRAEALDEAKRSLPVPIAEDDDAGPTRNGRRSAGSLRVGREPLTYEALSPHSFFRDQYSAAKGDGGAQERLRSHQREMTSERAIAETAGAGGEFVPPLYLDEYLTLARASRAYVDTLRRLPLPPNANTVSLPRLASGTATAAQADLGAVQATDPTTGTVDVPVITIAGQVDLARQLMDRAVPGMDEVLFSDLIADYDTKLDGQALSGSGAAPNARGVLNVAGINAVTYTDTTPSLPELYKKIADAIQRVHAGRFLAPSVIVMHPRRWAWMLSEVDTQNRPLIVPIAGAVNSAGILEGVAAEARVGTMQGLPVIVDPSIPTTGGAGANEDSILVQRVEDAWLLEDQPVKTRVYEDVLSGTLAIRVQVFNYAAISQSMRPKAISVISGSGLVSPAF